MSIRSVVKGIGASVPEKVLTNADLEKMVETTDEWIMQRTGIRERRICRPDESTGSLAISAARLALDDAGMLGKDVELIVVGTVTGDYPFPATACVVQDAVGANGSAAFDVSAACAGFIYSLASAAALIQTGAARNALVIGAECLSKITDYTDRSTCVLFGDAAGAVVLQGETDTNRGIIATVMRADGSGIKHLHYEVGGSKYPHCSALAEGKKNALFMAGSEVYRFAVKAMGEACHEVLEKAGMQPGDVDLFVPHQANIRIIESAAQKVSMPMDRVYLNVDRYGNTGAGSIPLALYEAEREGRLQRGMVVMTVGFGAGLSWGANLIRW